MIISGIIKQALDGMTLTYNEYDSQFVIKNPAVTKNVVFGFGDQQALVRFIASRSNLENFPLIWYEKPPYERILNTDMFKVKAQFVLMTSTKAEFYNEERALINYRTILEPLTIDFIKRLKRTNGINFQEKNVREYDKENFGLDVYRQQGTDTSKAPAIYVDARAVEVELLVTKKC